MSTLSSARSYNVVVHARTVHTPARLSPSPSLHTSARPSPVPSLKRKSPDAADADARKRRRQSAVSVVSLRRDADVATLLGMYDDAGALDGHAFESPEVGRVQRRRTGSTLRELLGDEDEGEGDLSWAERLLG
jgi:hypothetical protein